MNILVTGAGGFIGHHLVNFLKERGHDVIGVDIKKPQWEKSYADEFKIVDLRYPLQHQGLYKGIDEVYHLAADMGGIGYIETHKADIVFNNTMINMLTLKAAQEQGVKKFLFTSSACVYPDYLQLSEEAKALKEEDAYPAQAEDGYGWEKLMMERACRHFMEDYGLQTYVARFHNIYGPLGTYDGGKEKSPAALCRKVVLGSTQLDIWGNGKQVRSYCYIDDCVEALYALMSSNHHDPINIGTDDLLSIDMLANVIMEIACKSLVKVYDISKPRGVMGRNADITKARTVLNWRPKIVLEVGLIRTYKWIQEQISP